MKPFVKWAGGKRQLLPELYRLLPQELLTMDEITYIEPFVGGGAMLFFMIETFPNIKRVVANDINQDLINTYVVVRDHVGDLVARLSSLQYCYYKQTDRQSELYYELRNRYNDKTITSITERAALFIFLNHTCFNGLYRVNSKGEFNVPFGRYKKPNICDAETLRADSVALQGVEFICGDFTQTEHYASPNTFYYLDPPYRPLNSTSAFTAYSANGFSDADHLRLRNFCQHLRTKRAMLMQSNSDAKAKNEEDWDFNTIYESFYIERILASRAINSNGQRRGKLHEIVVRNYNQTLLHP